MHKSEMEVSKKIYGDVFLSGYSLKLAKKGYELKQAHF